MIEHTPEKKRRFDGIRTRIREEQSIRKQEQEAYKEASRRARIKEAERQARTRARAGASKRGYGTLSGMARGFGTHASKMGAVKDVYGSPKKKKKSISNRKKRKKNQSPPKKKSGTYSQYSVWG